MSEGDSAGAVGGASGGSSVGGADSVSGGPDNTPSAGDRADVSQAADNVGSTDVQGQAAATAGAEASPDSFDKVDEAAKKGPAAPGTPGGQPPATPPDPGLKDGQWLHDPRQTTPGQARELQQMLDRGGLHPDTEKAIRGFLEDYRNNTDRLFPDAPNPLPRDYPWPKNPSTVI